MTDWVIKVEKLAIKVDKNLEEGLTAKSLELFL
jgi:hypothetical protein